VARHVAAPRMDVTEPLAHSRQAEVAAQACAASPSLSPVQSGAVKNGCAAGADENRATAAHAREASAVSCDPGCAVGDALTLLAGDGATVRRRYAS